MVCLQNNSLTPQSDHTVFGFQLHRHIPQFPQNPPPQWPTRGRASSSNVTPRVPTCPTPGISTKKKSHLPPARFSTPQGTSWCWTSWLQSIQVCTPATLGPYWRTSGGFQLAESSGWLSKVEHNHCSHLHNPKMKVTKYHWTISYFHIKCFSACRNRRV